ncbi:MerR family transcriptional regulator [Clostridioides difficile]|uniref:MerR-family transcriptional regulator n=4 Tax=Clostridioides difficile TaxID=1496 RepID=A0A9R0BIF1_CLODR|nr:MerR family transcriptional regulator [Clostridioides difficile]OFU01383.1 MerR family transcriptional regulator [Clostridium sp. HMSC19E03]OFU18287.1 MerR family transcriptional regulator [Clostridium sp. HMSC19C08]OFU20262.1 MerR family transcriptional regulator [Clostridium sp. HMSC19C09]OFU24560.1 MerR family transcriptional regulator [Clostridium sp. HMSC19C05]OFU30887.1 MerR family transcriptional regulator [Clostridium sp. HMSC19B11]OFU36562.1 MerR family transcriptional regulator [
MFKIGEVSKLTQISIRMLRYYDELGILKPAEIDKYTGHRLYSVEQISILQRIVLLRDSKFSVAEIANIVHNWNDEFVIKELNRKKNEIQKEIKHEQQRINKIDKFIEAINCDKDEIHYNVVFKKIPSYKIISLREVVPDYQSEGILWEKLSKFIKEEHIEVSRQPNNNIAFYHDEEVKDNGVDIEVGMVVKKIGKNKSGFIYRETEEIDMMACTMVYGPYENIAGAYESFCYWLDKNSDYQISGINRQIGHKGEHNEINPENYLTEIQIPLIKV